MEVIRLPSVVFESFGDGWCVGKGVPENKPRSELNLWLGEPGKPVIWLNVSSSVKWRQYHFQPYQGFLSERKVLLWRLKGLMSLLWGTALE